MLESVAIKDIFQNVSKTQISLNIIAQNLYTIA